MTVPVPEAAMRQGSAVPLRVSAETVAAFAALTGDRSSLHVSDAFARRSAYRRPVVHGMLPVGFLALLPACLIEGFRCVPVELRARFTSPVYAGDPLTLATTTGRLDPGGGRVTLGFTITHDATAAAVTDGSLTLAYTRAASGDVLQPATAGDPSSMLLHPMDVSTLRLEQIEQGMRDRIDFRISPATVGAFLDLLARGGGVTMHDLAAVPERLDVPTLLTILLFSTSVGVSVPGAWATFLEFAARVDRPVDLATDYALTGEVTHRSRATRIIRKTLTAHVAGRPDEVALAGKVAALVNAPSRPGPSMTDLEGAARGTGLAGKIVLVTGASRGIGEATAKLFALSGARVIVNYHRGAEDAARVVREITAVGGEAMAIAADVTDPEQVRSLVRAACDGYGTIHVLVNNAARDFRPIPFLQLTWEEVQRDLDVIAKGAFLCCQQVVPLMLESGGGKIINISSVATDDPPPDQTKYVMAKAALVGLTRSLAAELASRNIQVNMVVPSFVETDLVAHVPEGFRRKIARDTPMGRLASAVDVAQAVLMLASPLSSFTTGQRLMVTGGGAPYL